MSTIIVRQITTRKYHQGFANCPGITLCNHSAQRRRARTRPAKPHEIQRADDRMFCSKCFSSEAMARAKGGTA
jgi:hypothetical protein